LRVGLQLGLSFLGRGGRPRLRRSCARSKNAGAAQI